MKEMEVYIIASIKRARKISLVSGQNKYRQFFILTTEFEAEKAEVDTALTLAGIADCIVTA